MTDTLASQGEGAALAPVPLDGAFLTEKSKLFWLAFWTGLLTVLTLGIYRFWARTRLRRYIWSAIDAGGDSFEYTGMGLEKFLGFLIALVVLAVYLGLLQVGLSFIGFNLWGAVTLEPSGPRDVLIQVGATYVTGLAVYMLSRTRWRGLRFGLDAAAWGYVWRALLYFALSLVTLGLLIPLSTFRLEKYMTDRMWYGDAVFEQQGQWWGLYPAMKHLLIALGVLVLGGAVGYFGLARGLGAVILIAGSIWFLCGLVYYQVESFKYLSAHKVLDGTVRFTSNASSHRVIGIFVLGIILIAILTFVLSVVLGVLIGIVFASGGSVMNGDGAGIGLFAGAGVAVALAAVLGYIAFLVLIGALVTVFISAPILGHYIDTLRVENAQPLEQINQRAGDRMADADGFADALDIGGAF